MNDNETIGALREENRRLRAADDVRDRMCAANVQARQVLGEAKDTVEQAKDGWTKAQIDGLVSIVNRALWILEGK
jgi:hypothetical protein